MARVGKIARLPLEVREELNRRLQAGELGPQLLPWLNAMPEVQKVVADFFSGQAINAQNLSDWRLGGFTEWLEKQDRTHRVKELAKYAAELARANGASIAEGASAIASGRILELLEAVDGKLGPEDLGEIITGLTNLRKADISQGRLEVGRGRLKQLEEQLALEKQKFARQTAELFIKWYDSQQAKEIAASPASNTEKIEKLGALMFGDEWN